MDIYEEPIKEQVKGCTILGWNITPEEQLAHINLGSPKVPQLMKISIEVSGEFLKGVKVFFCEYKDVFGWSYQDMKGESIKKGAKQCVDIPLKLFFEFLKNHHGNTIYQKNYFIF